MTDFIIFKNVYFRIKFWEFLLSTEVYILEFYILSEFAFLGETLINQNHQNHENSRKQVRCQSERMSKLCQNSKIYSKI